MQTKSIKNPVKIEMCALYLRLSKEDEKGTESASIENQRKILMEYARKNKFVIYDEYVDGPVKIGLNQKHPTARGALV